MYRLSRRFFAATFLFLFFPVSAENWEQLIELDKIKTQNYEKFSVSLDELIAKNGELSINEQYYVQLLDLFRRVYLKGYNDVISDLEQLLEKDIPNELKLRLYALAVNAYQLKRDYRKAFLYADDILRVSKDVNDVFTLRQVLAPVAQLFIDARQKELAAFVINRLRDVTKRENRSCYASYLEFRLHLQFSDIDSLETSADVAIKSCEAIGEKLWQELTYVQLAKALLENKRVNDAIVLMDSVRESAKKSTYPVLVATVFAIDAYIALLDNDNQKAKNYLKLAFEMSDMNESKELQLFVYHIAYKLAVSDGNFEIALDYFKNYSDIANVLDKDRADKQLSYELVKSEVEVKNQRIELLNKDNELLFLQNSVVVEEVRQTRVMIAVLAVVLSIAMYLAYKGLTGRHRFKKIAEFDQLTGISNRYHFNNQAELALEFCRKNNQPAAVILFDLDHFKSINDNHGHAVGDWALQAVVGTCRHFMRNNDVFGRIGGEEFAVVLPGCQTDKAALLAEICRDAIAAIDTEDSGTTFPLTASFGVSGSDSSGYQLKQLLADADKAMYRAKDGGRDQVVSFAEA